MTFASDMQDVGFELVGDLADEVADFLVKTTTHDPSTGEVTVSGTVTHTFDVSWSSYDQDMIDGTTVRADDARVILPAKGLTFTPVNLMKLTALGQTWTIINIKPVRAQATVIIYDIQVRS